ncbi:MAG: hypothetical protein ACREOO_32895, partial [bacterium]
MEFFGKILLLGKLKKATPMNKYVITDDQREFISGKILLIKNQLYHYVCPIFHVDTRGELSLYGSSVLLNIEPYYFLITAAHVIAPSKRRSMYLWGKSGEVSLRMMVRGSFHITSSDSDDHEDDEVDLAHALLVDDAPEILKDFSFLNLSSLKLNDKSFETKTYITI